MKLSLLARILITLGLVSVLSLLFVWMVVCPKYEAMTLTEKLTVIKQLQKSSVDNLDNTIASWSKVSRFITSEVTEKPNEGETVLRMMMKLHPEIVQMRIHSSSLPDELKSQNTSYPTLTLQISDSIWVHSKIDSALHIAWLNRTESPAKLFIMQTQFQVQHIPFVLTIVWDAKQLNDILNRLPFENEYVVGIYSSSGIITQNAPSFNLENTYGTMERLNNVQSLQEGTNSWRILTNAFQSVQLWIVIAVPGKIFTKPVEDFMFYSGSLIFGLMIILSIFGWLLSHQLKKFIEKMRTFLNANSE
jgi:hypothetical protein